MTVTIDNSLAQRLGLHSLGLSDVARTRDIVASYGPSGRNPVIAAQGLGEYVGAVRDTWRKCNYDLNEDPVSEDEAKRRITAVEAVASC